MGEGTKVYCIINANPEGFNLIGIYSSKEQAEAETEAINQQIHLERTELYKDFTMTEEHRQEFINNDWDKCHVVEWELNTRGLHTSKDYEDAQTI